MFYTGQKVVCVDADGAVTLKLNAVYTIKTVVPVALAQWRRRVRMSIGILLYEAEPTTGEDFAPERFRPAVERKTDISIFMAMLTPNRKKVLA